VLEVGVAERYLRRRDMVVREGVGEVLGYEGRHVEGDTASERDEFGLRYEGEKNIEKGKLGNRQVRNLIDDQ
jgi:hypothetical protein